MATLRRSQESGPFGRGGQRPICQRIEFFGSLGEPFLAFAKARAERLDLKGWISGDEKRAMAHVEGPEALVGAFEVACCIGPDLADVQDWACRDADPDLALNGFALRRF